MERSAAAAITKPPPLPRGRTLSTRARILAAILSVATLGLVVAGTVTFTMQRQRVMAGLDQQLTYTVGSVISPSAAIDQQTGANDAPAGRRLDPASVASIDEFMDAAKARPLANYEASFGLVSGKVVFATSAKKSFDPSADKQMVSQIVADATRADDIVMGTASSTNGPVRYAAVQVKIPADGSSGVLVHAFNLRDVLAPMSATVVTYLFTCLATLAAIAIVGWLVLGRLMLSPMRQMQQAAGSIGLAEMGHRMPSTGNDDVAVLGRTVNEMLDRLEGSVGVQRQLLDDIRHELKTPITIVRGHLEMMDRADPHDVESAREIGISELDRMSRLIEDIDALAAVEDDELTLATIDVGTLTEHVGDLVAVIPGHTWHVATQAPGDFRGNFDRLVQAWLALADNAAKYTPQGSPIEIGSTRAPDGFHLWVRDHGPGIAPAHRHRIFRRFDRGGGRRDVGGSGLGLAIVDAIARGHGGSCTVTDTPGGGATFVIRVPARLGHGASVLPAPVRAGSVVRQREETG